MIIKLLKEIEDVADKEYERAVLDWGKFTNIREAESVLREEVEEAEEETRYLKMHFDHLWYDIKSDNSKEAILDRLQEVNAVAQRLAAEAVQVMAVSRKAAELCRR